MEIIMRKVGSLTPYERNTKKHDQKQIDNVANSIKRFGWRQPMVIDDNGVVVIGHCRLLAAKKLGMKEVPCTVASGLTDAEIRELRIADNKTNESPWDMDALALEMPDLDFEGFDFDITIPIDAENARAQSWFDTRERYEENDGTDEEYNDFLEKFEPKKTTDDCYTPDNIYDAVAEWVASEYGVARECFVRPFYPGGDYQKYRYPEGCVVVDNPPFSILSEIVRFYHGKGIRFFLFAPALTFFNAARDADVTYIATKTTITYENGAMVSTSFITNLEPRVAIRTAPALYALVEAENKANEKAMHKDIPKYTYPDEVLTAAMVGRYSKYGIDYSVPKGECEFISAPDAQKEADKGMYGAGFLISKRCAAEKAAAENAAANKAAANKAAANKAVANKAAEAKAAAEKAAATIWPLSEREKAIVERLSR